MKVLFGMVLTLLIMCNTVFAATFSQPEKIGRISFERHTGFSFGGIFVKISQPLPENPITAKTNKSAKKPVETVKCKIQFKDSADGELFFHYTAKIKKKRYKDVTMHMGEVEIENTVPITVESADIYKIQNDDGKVFYLIEDIKPILIGKNSDGKFITYFNVHDEILNHWDSKRRD